MDDGDREILDHFVRTREKTKELLRRVPDEWLGRVAEGEEYPLTQVFLHTGCGELWWMYAVLKDGGPESYDWAKDKKEILECMDSSRDRVTSFFEAENGKGMGEVFSLTDSDKKKSEWTGRYRVHYFTDHEVHHRGKIVLALRQWGMTDIPFLPY